VHRLADLLKEVRTVADLPQHEQQQRQRFTSGRELINAAVLGARLAARARHKATGLLLCSLPQALYESLGVFACDLFREGRSDRKAHAGFDGFCGGV